MKRLLAILCLVTACGCDHSFDVTPPRTIGGPIIERTTTGQRWYDEGRLAHRMGVPAEANPYVGSWSSASADWLAGWIKEAKR